MESAPGPSNSNRWLKSENKATWSKKASEIGSLAVSYSDSTIRTETRRNIISSCVILQIEIAKEKIEFLSMLLLSL